MSEGWFAETDICRCGHGRNQHGPDGRCNLYADSIPMGESPPGHVQQVRQPEGTCWCRSFNGEPWPWQVWTSYEPKDNGDSSWSVEFEGAKSYMVRRQNHEKTFGPYKTQASARRRCDELNREMAQGPLDPAFVARRRRLVRLAPGGVYYLHQGAPGTEWPVRPDRYLIFGFADGWHGDSWVDLKPTLEAVREALEDEEGNEIDRVVDLDTGEDVQFEREVTVKISDPHR